MKKIFIYIIAFSIILTTGCQSVQNQVPNPPEESVTQTQTQPTTTTMPSVTTIEEITANIPTLEPVEFFNRLEAEAGNISGDLKLSQTKKGYSGVGYITGFSLNPENKLNLSFKIPASQHYNISLIVSSENKKNNILTINDNEVSEFITTGGDKFEKITINNVYIGKGMASVGIKEVTGGIDIDYVEIQNSKDIWDINLAVGAELINANANVKTKNTMKYLAENYGKNMISGQYATIGTKAELDLIYKNTGHYPAIRLGDLLPYTSNSVPQSSEIERAIEWSNMGGIVSYVWHWEAPMDESSYYTKETAFDLSKGVTSVDVANLSQDELLEMQKRGEISAECMALIRDIDIISKQLQNLQENNVTVLWRPLHEASGGWFWWGAKGDDTYKWLWELLYKRQTEYFGLNNLIWVWNAQEAGWYVGDDFCDIISADIYVDNNNENSQVNTFIQLSKISDKKIIALSECANAPNADFMVRDKAMWSWFGVWSGDYIINSFGELSETYTTKQQLLELYSHENIITLDKLPDLRVWGG